MKKQILVFILIISVFSACNKKVSEEVKTESSKEVEVNKFKDIKNLKFSRLKDTDLYTWVDQLRLREKPDLNSNTLKVLNQGEKLISLNKAVDENFEVEIRGKKIEGNWEYVKTTDDIDGWVFSGCLSIYRKHKTIAVYAIDNEIYIKNLKADTILYKDKVNNVEEAYVWDVKLDTFKNYLLIYPISGPYDYGYPLYIYDIEKNEVIAHFFDADLLIGYSPDENYIAYDSGTAVTGRSITIFSFKDKKVVFAENPTYYEDNNWTNSGIIKYYVGLGKKIDGKPEIKEFSEQYGQVYFWKDGVITKGGIEVTVCEQ